MHVFVSHKARDLIVCTRTFNRTRSYARSPKPWNGDTVDLLWLVIPGAILLFIVRTLMIARSLQAAASNPTLADIRAFREAKRSLRAHHDRLREAVAQPKGHLQAAKRMAAVPRPRATTRPGRVSPIVEDAIPDRRA